MYTNPYYSRGKRPPPTQEEINAKIKIASGGEIGGGDVPTVDTPTVDTGGIPTTTPQIGRLSAEEQASLGKYMHNTKGQQMTAQEFIANLRRGSGIDVTTDVTEPIEEERPFQDYFDELGTFESIYSPEYWKEQRGITQAGIESGFAPLDRAQEQRLAGIRERAIRQQGADSGLAAAMSRPVEEYYAGEKARQVGTGMRGFEQQRLGAGMAEMQRWYEDKRQNIMTQLRIAVAQEDWEKSERLQRELAKISAQASKDVAAAQSRGDMWGGVGELLGTFGSNLPIIGGLFK